MQIVNWQCNFTEHQLHTWVALQSLLDDPIIHIIAKTTGGARSNQNWSTIDLSSMNVIHFGGKNWLRKGIHILRQYPDAIHVFGGFWADRRFILLIMLSIFLKIPAVVMNEPYSIESVGYLRNSRRIGNQIKVYLRPLLYKIVALVIRTLASPNRFCMLALSSQAVDQLIKAGFEPDQTFPFGYFVPKLKCTNKKRQSVQSCFRFVFVGSLIQRKGLDIAVAAIEDSYAGGLPVYLDVFGPGDPDEYIDPASKCVAYKGVIPFGQAQAVIMDYDALILPSLHDGWGVVVNEGLLQGIPAIVSSNVGAKCLLEQSGAGLVFKNGDQQSLKDNIAVFIKESTLRNQMKYKAESLAELITPENAAKYLFKVLQSYFFSRCEPPVEIWRLP